MSLEPILEGADELIIFSLRRQ